MLTHNTAICKRAVATVVSDLETYMIKQKLVIALAAFSCCAGCITPQVWYAPQTNAPIPVTPGTWNLRDSYMIDLSTNVFLSVRVEAPGFSEEIWLHIALSLPTNNWAQFESDTIQLSGENHHQSAVVSRIEGCLPKGSTFESHAYESLDKLEGPGGFDIRVAVPRFRPAKLRLQLPPLTLNGNTVEIPAMDFVLKRGVIFYQQLQ